MANKAITLLVAGGAALILMGGKNKKKSGRASQACTIIRTDEDLTSMLDSQEQVRLPMAMIVYPSGMKSEGEKLCNDLAAAGARTVVLAADHMNKFLSDFYEANQIELPVSFDKITTPGLAIENSRGERMILWNDIPWNDVKSLLA